MPIFFSAPFADAQSAVGASSGIDALALRAYHSPTSRPYADADIFCDDPKCGASLMADQLWAPLADFGAFSGALRFGAASRVGDATDLAELGWTTNGGAPAATLVYGERSVQLAAGTSLEVSLPLGDGELVVAAHVGSDSKCAVAISDSLSGRASLTAVPLSSGGAGPIFEVVHLSYSRDGASANATNTSADRSASRSNSSALPAAPSPPTPTFSLRALDGTCSLAYALRRSSGERGLLVDSSPFDLMPSALGGTLPLSPPLPTGTLVQLVATAAVNAGLSTLFYSHRRALRKPELWGYAPFLRVS